ncbi:hypothetical protein WN51_11772 [Melipona quadrifasciata]|uniref:Uncharacterized protein n=1 Tax=Melipona quadrifasciata TaxID=166423 RepID=A0A0M9A4Z4_9HYME|nr:hypothetical protein WN51_11772 [Melipona quadrifasciata]
MIFKGIRYLPIIEGQLQTLCLLIFEKRNDYNISFRRKVALQNASSKMELHLNSSEKQKTSLTFYNGNFSNDVQFPRVQSSASLSELADDSGPDPSDPQYLSNLVAYKSIHANYLLAGSPVPDGHHEHGIRSDGDQKLYKEAPNPLRVTHSVARKKLRGQPNIYRYCRDKYENLTP